MEEVCAFLDLKITQNKEKLLYSLFYSMECTRWEAKARQPGLKEPQPLHPAINDPKYAVWGKLMLFVSSDSKQQMPVAPWVEGNAHSGV